MSERLSGPYDDGYHAGYRAARAEQTAELTELQAMSDVHYIATPHPHDWYLTSFPFYVLDHRATDEEMKRFRAGDDSGWVRYEVAVWRCRGCYEMEWASPEGKSLTSLKAIHDYRR